MYEPPVLVLSRTASSVSAEARVGVRRTFTGLVRKEAAFVITRHLSAVHRTSIVLMVGSKGVVRRKGRRMLVGGRNFCRRLCRDRFSV